MILKNTAHDMLKAELHCHLPGIISPAMLRHLRDTESVLVDPEQLAALCPAKGIEGFNNWMSFMKPYQQCGSDIFLPILSSHIDDLVQQNVVYTEIMISPSIFPRKCGMLMPAFATFRNAVDILENGRIKVEFLIVIPRSLTASQLETDTQDIIQLYKAGCIAGVALVGMEDGYSLRRFYRYFAQMKDQGLGVEIHAGEHSGPSSVTELLDMGIADRIGHGIGAFQDRKTLQRLCASGIHLEFCITSNLYTGSVRHLHEHPVILARALGMNYSINTDDPATFMCTINSEYSILCDQMGFTLDDLNNIFRNSMASRFRR